MQEIDRTHAVVWVSRIRPCAGHARLGDHLGSYRHELCEDRFHIEATKGSILHDPSTVSGVLLAAQKKKSLFVLSSGTGIVPSKIIEDDYMDISKIERVELSDQDNTRTSILLDERCMNYR